MSSFSQENISNNSKDISQNNEGKKNKSLKEKYKIVQENHPLEFYALGKINTNLYKNSSTFYNSSSLSSPRLTVNNKTNNLFERNLLSINNSYFEHLKKVKNSSPVNQLNIEENNYLNPLLILKKRKDEKIECQKRNNINSLEWLNIIKNKLYSVDIKSKIKFGTNVSRNQFYEEKNKIILSPRRIQNNSVDYINQNKTSYQFENNNNSYDGNDYNYNTSGSFENILKIKRFKKDNEKLNQLRKNCLKPEKTTDYWKKLKIEKSLSTDELINRDFKKSDEKKLKSNFLYFDKNYKEILRNKNWWKIDK